MHSNQCYDGIADAVESLDKVVNSTEHSIIDDPAAAMLWERLVIARKLLHSVMTALSEQQQ